MLTITKGKNYMNLMLNNITQINPYKSQKYAINSNMNISLNFNALTKT